MKKKKEAQPDWQAETVRSGKEALMYLHTLMTLLADKAPWTEQRTFMIRESLFGASQAVGAAFKSAYTNVATKSGTLAAPAAAPVPGPDAPAAG